MKAEQQDEHTRADAHPVDCTALVAIPPPYSKGNRTGKTTGCAEALRAMKVGDMMECPREWESGIGSAAQRIGIKIVRRRMGASATTTIWRTE